MKKKEEESLNEGEAVDGCLECCRRRRKQAVRVVRQEEGRGQARFEFLTFARGRKKI